MKMIAEIQKDLNYKSKKLIQKLIEAQKETAETIKADVVAKSPRPSGEYASSIKCSDTKYEENVIKTSIYTDMKSEDGYFIGRMIENGTGIYALEPHIGTTKTFIASGYRYWYVPASSVKRPIGKKITINGEEYYVAKAQPPKPHFRPALEENIATYRANIKKAIKEAL